MLTKVVMSEKLKTYKMWSSLMHRNFLLYWPILLPVNEGHRSTDTWSHCIPAYMCLSSDFSQWQWTRCVFQKKKPRKLYPWNSELVHALWEWPTSSCFFLRGIYNREEKQTGNAFSETDIIRKLAKKKLASLKMLVRMRGRVIPTVSSLSQAATWGMLCAA